MDFSFFSPITPGCTGAAGEKPTEQEVEPRKKEVYLVFESEVRGGITLG